MKNEKSSAVVTLLFATIFLLSGETAFATGHDPAPNRKSNNGKHAMLPHAASASVAQKMEPIVVRITKYHVKPASQKQLRQAIAIHVAKSFKLESNLMIEAFRETPDSTFIWVIERWKTTDAMERNDLTASSKKLKLLSRTGLQTPAETILGTDLEPLTKELYRKMPNPGDKPMVAMLFVDTQSGKENDFRSIYHAAMPSIRKEPGVITYQLSQQQGDPTKFITYEKFRNEQALQPHLKYPFVQPIMNFLATSIKEKPFDKFLHKLKEFAPLNVN